jgi:hypothetical protein
MLSSFIYDMGEQLIGRGEIDLKKDKIMVALVGEHYTPHKSHQSLDKIFAFSYTGPKPLPNDVASAFRDKSYPKGRNLTVEFTDIPWRNELGTANYVVMYKDNGTPATSPLLLCYTGNCMGLPLTPNGGNITVVWEREQLYKDFDILKARFASYTKWIDA